MECSRLFVSEPANPSSIFQDQEHQMPHQALKKCISRQSDPFFFPFFLIMIENKFLKKNEKMYFGHPISQKALGADL
jgi:hypothetical protein